MVNDSLEYMGFGWLDEVKKYMIERVKYIPSVLELAKNSRILNNINTQYMAAMARGVPAADIVSGVGDFVKWTPRTYELAREIRDKLNVPQLLVLNYFLAIYNLSASGKIPLEKWNPKEWEKQKELQQTISTEQSVWNKTGQAFGKFSSRLLIPLGIVGGLIGAAYVTQKNKES